MGIYKVFYQCYNKDIKVVKIGGNMTGEQKAICDKLYEVAKEKLNFLAKEAGIGEDELKEYFIIKKPETFKEIYEVVLSTLQDYQTMPNTIKFNIEEYKTKYRELLCDFDISQVANKTEEQLFTEFKYFSKRTIEAKSNWGKWLKGALSSAKFLCKFNTVQEFLETIEFLDKNNDTREACALWLQKHIHGMGFALACNFLKDIGFENFAKPDVHIKDVLVGAKLSDDDELKVYEIVVEMAEIKKTTAFKIDRLIWLVCSGNFFHHNITVKGQKMELIKAVNGEN